MRALWDKALQIDILPKVPDLWETLGSAVQTDLSLTDILSLAYIGVQLEPQNLKGRFIGRGHVQGWVTPKGAQVLLPRPVEMQAALVEFFAPPVQEVSALTAEGARIVMRNGTNRPGLAALAADRLRWEGVLQVTAADADRQDYSQTRLTIYADKPLTEAVRELARARDDDGYMATVEEEGNSLVLSEHNCPIYDVAQRFPQACQCEHELFERVLNRPVKREITLVQGAPACRYRISSAEHP